MPLGPGAATVSASRRSGATPTAKKYLSGLSLPRSAAYRNNGSQSASPRGPPREQGIGSESIRIRLIRSGSGDQETASGDARVVDDATCIRRAACVCTVGTYSARVFRALLNLTTLTITHGSPNMAETRSACTRRNSRGRPTCSTPSRAKRSSRMFSWTVSNRRSTELTFYR